MTIETTNSNPQGANVDNIDEIVNLLIDDDTVEDTKESNDQPEESNSAESSEEVENEDETEETEETEEVEAEAAESESDTWGSALGITDDNVSLDDDGNFKGIVTKVDGVSETVSLKDLVSGYQNNKFNTNKSQTISEDKKVFEEEKERLTSQYSQKLESINALSDYLTKKLTSEYDQVDWQQLRLEDPAEYAAMRQDYAAKAQEMQQLHNAVGQENSNMQAENDGKQKEQYDSYMRKEFDSLIENNPNWKDQEVYRTDMTGLKSFMTDKYGFTEEDFSQITDHRAIELIKDAKAFRDGKSSADKKLKKPVPKFQSSKTRKVAKKVTKLDTLTKRAKSSSGAAKRSAQTDAIAELLKEG